MPIGKNAIKRVENNGYSKVKTAAPDMENSTVIAKISEEVMDKMVKPVEEKTKAKTAAKKAPAKKAVVTKAEPKIEAKKEEVKKAPVKKATAKKAPAKKPVAKKTEKDGFERVSVGNDMPYYLL